MIPGADENIAVGHGLSGVAHGLVERIDSN